MPSRLFAMLFQWEQFFWSYLVLGPYLMTYSWLPVRRQSSKLKGRLGCDSRQTCYSLTGQRLRCLVA